MKTIIKLDATEFSEAAMSYLKELVETGDIWMDINTKTQQVEIYDCDKKKVRIPIDLDGVLYYLCSQSDIFRNKTIKKSKIRPKNSRVGNRSMIKTCGTCKYFKKHAGHTKDGTCTNKKSFWSDGHIVLHSWHLDKEKDPNGHCGKPEKNAGWLDLWEKASAHKRNIRVHL